jgi:hypothetical protein
MKRYKIAGFLLCFTLLITTDVFAGDFAWMNDLTIEAKGDLSRYRTRLATRFHIGNVEIDAVLGKVSHHADAYMVLRLRELSGLSLDVVLDRYHEQNQKGWGALAKSLGIKPGSSEFHRLKQGHDLEGYPHYISDHGDEHGKGGDKGKGNGKSHNNGKGKPNNKNK